MSDKTERLHQTIAAVCPIDGVAVRTPGDSATVRIDFKASATNAQKTAAAAALTAFDWSDAAQVAWEAAQNPDKDGLVKAAAQAIADNDAFIAIASPSNAQNAAQIKALTRQVNRLIKRTIQLTG